MSLIDLGFHVMISHDGREVCEAMITHMPVGHKGKQSRYLLISRGDPEVSPLEAQRSSGIQATGPPFRRPSIIASDMMRKMGGNGCGELRHTRSLRFSPSAVLGSHAGFPCRSHGTRRPWTRSKKTLVSLQL